MSGGWGAPRVPVVQAIKEAADNYRRRYREGTYLPPSNDPERPPKGPASGTLPKGPASVSAPVANPERIQVNCYHCCGNHAGCTSNATVLELADAPDDDD